MTKTSFVHELPIEAQEDIRGILEEHLFYSFGLVGEERDEVIEAGMNGRLCDLEEVIDIEEYIN